MRRLFGIGCTLLVLTVLSVLAWTSWFAVDETEFVLLTAFGRPIQVFGDDPGETGFHLKWPWWQVLSIDRRIQVSEPATRELITGDKRNLEVAAFLVWKVTDAETFLRGAGSLATASDRLEERVASALSDVIGKTPLEALASTDPKTWRLDTLTHEVRESVAHAAASELGVEILDVGLRRFNHPVEVRPAVFDLIRSERKRVAATLRAEGEASFQKLKSEADRRRDLILAQADSEAEKIRGRGDAESIKILNAAHAQDPKFYEFLKMLETYRSLIDDKATVILSAKSPLLRLFTQGPTDDVLKAPVELERTGR